MIISYRTKLTKLWHWLLRFVYVQLFLTLISLPILIWWGLPLSLLVLLGNLLFTPLLTLFLLLNSFVFFCELFSVPNSCLIQCIELLGSLWTRLLKIPDNTCLIAIRPHFFLCIAPFLAITILYTKKLHTLERRLMALALLLIMNLSYCFMIQNPINYLQTLPCNNGEISLIYTNNQLTLIDPGVIGQRSCAISWIQYTLLPHMAKTFGTTSIEHIIILQPNKVLFESLAHLCTLTPVKKVYIPYWHNNDMPPKNSGFNQMKHTLEKNGTTIIRYAEKQTIINLNTKNYIIIDPMDIKINKTAITYTGYCITMHHDDQKSHVYSYALKHKQHLIDKKSGVTNSYLADR